MRFIFYSPNFLPMTGGLEHVVRDLAEAFVRAGHEVTVLTRTGAETPDDFIFKTLRCPGLFKQVKVMRQANGVLMFNVSLKGILPWWLSGRPLAISHQTPYPSGWRGRLKTWVSNHWSALNIGCSRFMAGQFRDAIAIGNPYDDLLFRETIPWEQRGGDLIFVGRLVSDKGVDLLLDAMAVLQQTGLRPNLTIVGSGPEEAALRMRVQMLGLEAQVRFAGLKQGEALVEVINTHRIMVVPSRWNEPFGIVALEGLACGCIVVGSKGGGLQEAIGALGYTFPNGDKKALVALLQQILLAPELHRPKMETLIPHVQRHTKMRVAAAYLDALEPVFSRQGMISGHNPE